MWKELIHPNVVPFIGVTFSPLQIVSKWMPDGDLTTYIKLKPDANRIALVSPSCLTPPETLPYCPCSWLTSQMGSITFTLAT